MRRRADEKRWLFIWEGFFDGLGYVFDGGFFGELADFGLIGFFVETHFGGDVAVHAEDGGDLFFGEEEDLEHKVVAFVRAAAQAALADQDEAGEQDGFHGDAGLEEAEGPGVEAVGRGEDVEEDPGGEDEEMQGYEGE